MSAENAPERRRGERRQPDEQRFWRALKGERRVAERRRGYPGGAGEDDATAAHAGPAAAPSAPAAPAPPREVSGSRSASDTASVGGARDADTPGTPSTRDAPDAPDRRDAADVRKPEATGATDTSGRAAPPAPEERRREALRRLLRAAEARRGRGRQLVLAKGTRVVVTSGECVGETGVVLDADYIHSRVLLRLDGRESPSWVPFSTVGAPERPSDDP